MGKRKFVAGTIYDDLKRAQQEELARIREGKPTKLGIQRHESRRLLPMDEELPRYPSPPTTPTTPTTEGMGRRRKTKKTSRRRKVTRRRR